ALRPRLGNNGCYIQRTRSNKDPQTTKSGKKKKKERTGFLPQLDEVFVRIHIFKKVSPPPCP
ncbi:hypothetical protein ILYODFUR_031543, partial [Ilyodon furcidens]